MSLIKKTGKALADLIPGLGRLTFDTDIGTVFITSGTGVIGYRVAMSLLEAGHKSVRVGIWMGDRELGPGAEDKAFAENITSLLESKGATVINFDWSDKSCYKEALSGVKTVFCTLPHMDEWASVFPTWLNACKATKVEHFVKISFLRNQAGDEYRKNVPFVKFHSTCDDLLEQAPNSSRISYTILCTSHIMATPLLHQGRVLTEEHKYVTASYGMGVNYVSPNDVADAAVVVLLNQKGHRNKVYNLTGPGPIFDKDVAKLLSKAYGTEIEHISLGYHDYKKTVKARGLPNWLIRDSAAFEKMKASGIDELNSSYTNDVEKITGLRPESFADYLDNKNSQRPGRRFGRDDIPVTVTLLTE
jgi:NAD(P)H dehydrogenase (quinone)